MRPRKGTISNARTAGNGKRKYTAIQDLTMSRASIKSFFSLRYTLWAFSGYRLPLK
jgi:hypothetical protein